MRSPDLVSFIREQRGVNTAIDDVRAALSSLLPYFISAKSISGVNSDSDNIACRDLLQLKPLERFIDKDGISEFTRRCRCQNVKPTWSDDRRSKRRIAWIDKVDLQGSSFNK